MAKQKWINEIESNYEKKYIDSLNGKKPNEINYFPENKRPTREQKVPGIEAARIEGLKYNLPIKLQKILDTYKYAVHYKETSVVIVVDGFSGMGKSTIAGQIGLNLDPSFSIKNYHWDTTTFLEGEEQNGNRTKKGLKDAVKGDCIILDEAMLVSNRSSLSKLNKAVVQAMSMIRSKNLFVIFCVNSIFDLDKNLAISRANILFHVYGKNLFDRGQFAAFFKSTSDKRNRLKELYLLGKKYYNYSKPKANFNSMFPKHFVVDNNEYDDLKDKCIALFLQQDDALAGNKYRRSIKYIIVWIVQKYKLTNQQISEICDLSEKTITTLINEWKKEKGMVNTSKHLSKMDMSEISLI